MSSIFHGGNTYIFYNTDAGNNIPTAIGYKNIDELGAFPQVKLNSSTTQIETYDDEWVQVLSGNMSIDSVSIVVHYVADNESHVFLDNAFTNQTNFQIKVSLYESETSLEQHYVILSGYITAYNDSADQNEVYNRSYTFTAEDLIARGTATDPAPLKVGDFGVGADGETIPQYESSTPSGNSFIKVPALRSDNPLGIDMGGFAYVDNGGDQTAQFIIAETGPLNLFIKNTNNGWTQLKTTAQNDLTYVPLNRTVNGKSLSANITLSSSDTGSLALTGGTLTGALTATTATFTGAVTASSLTLSTPLSVSNGGTGANTSADARTNLSVYSKSEMDTTVATLVPKNTTVNGHALSDNITVTASDVGLGAVLNAVQLVASNNLSDVADVTTSRTNILAAKSGANSDITSISGLTTALSISQGGTGNSTGLAASATKLATARTITTNLASTTAGSFDGTANITPGISGILPIANGGTGASTAAAARTNLGVLSLSGGTLTGDLVGVNFTGSGVNATSLMRAGDYANSQNYVQVGNGSLEIYSSSPLIDFHYGNNSIDYVARIINDGTLTLTANFHSTLSTGGGLFRVQNGGYCCKAGSTGAFSSYGYNMNWINPGSGSQMALYVGDTNTGYITTTSTSDKGLKKDIEYTSVKTYDETLTDKESAANEVAQWKTATFKYKARGIIEESTEKFGFIANDLVLVSPETVTGEGLPEDYDIEQNPNDIGTAYGLDQVAMIAKLTLTVQHLMDEIAVLKETNK